MDGPLNAYILRAPTVLITTLNKYNMINVTLKNDKQTDKKIKTAAHDFILITSKKTVQISFPHQN